VPASDILQLAAAASIPERTLERAKALARVKSYQVWLKTGERVWYWFDPAAPWPANAPFPRPESYSPPTEFEMD
jgi:hypothetical protein